MAALEADQGGLSVAVDLDQSAREQGRTAGDVGQNQLVDASLAH